ncbi:TBC1 domain family member 22B [Fukomys damarensis]|uniref:TBC1 domain family member 22B n=1 Tax=Fukomys damarensis TaxID=885580 RepID=A0A091DPJ8_FUKDA|nr:TBC1 domain family member 22B [Fukomys damarensis]
MSKLLDGIEDNYTFAQPGIQKKVMALEELIDEQVEYLQFALGRMNTFLGKWRREILDEEDFQGLLMLLQNLPTIHWGNKEMGCRWLRRTDSSLRTPQIHYH